MSATNLQGTEERVELELPNKPEFISLARLAVSSLANMIGFSIDEIEDIKVALSEACTNAMQYGCKNQNSYKTTFEIGPDFLSVCVKDTGDLWDIDAVKEPSLKGDQVGGFGLYIIRTLMDEMDITSQESGTTLTMKKLLRPQNGVQ